MWIRLDAVDVLLFRDARPFEGGTDVTAAGVFPPPPTTVMGALRAAVLARHDVHPGAMANGGGRNGSVTGLIKRIGGADSLGNLTGKGPWRIKDAPGGAKALFPLPANLVPPKDSLSPGLLESIENPWPVRVKPPRLGMTSAPQGPLKLHAPVGPGAGPEGAYLIDGDQLLAFLRGNIPQGPDRTPAEATEPRTGIARDEAARVTKTGMLYTAGFVRPVDHPGTAVGLLYEVSGLEPADLASGLAHLGGERRVAALAVLNDPPPIPGDAAKDEIAQALIGKKSFLLYLATPAPWANGWLPDLVDETFKGEVDRVPVTLTAAWVGKPEYVSSWDLAKRMPRPLLAAAPAGSVYMFEVADLLNEDDARRLVAALHFTSALKGIDRHREFLSKAGFGVAMVGSPHYKADAALEAEFV